MEQVSRKFHLSLLGRISLALAAVAAVPIVVLSFRLGDLNRQALEDEVLKTHVVVARTVASRVDSLLASQRAAAFSVASNPTFLEAPRSPAGSELLAGLLAAVPDLVAVVAQTPDGEEILRAQHRGQGAVVESVLALPRASEEAAVEGDWLGDLVEAGGGSWLRLKVPMAEDRGALLLISPASILDSALVVPELGLGAELVLATRDRRRVAGSASLDGFPPAFLEQAATGQVQGAQRELKVEGQSFLGSYSPIADAPWFVASLQPSSVAEQTARRLRHQTLLAILVAALLTAALSFLAYRSLVRPVRRLLTAQQKLAGIEVSEGDELKQMRQTFEILERRIEDKEALGEVFLDRFEVKEVLGEGAMGTVFRGWDPRLQRPVALKTVRLASKGQLKDRREELFTRLQQEAVLGARLQHENIVAVYDLVRDGDVGFLAMEFVEGVTLARYLWLEGGILPAWEVVQIGAAVAQGLAAAHANGIVHHDIKPANVLLGRDGSIKLADFGIGRFFNSVVSAESESLFGTPGYLPPETLRGKGYGPRSDLFALGSVLHESITGELPFEGESVRQLIVSTLAGHKGRREGAWDDVPADLQPLLSSLLDPDPDQRPTSAQLVAETLRDLDHYWIYAWAPSFGMGSPALGVNPTHRAQVIDTIG